MYAPCVRVLVVDDEEEVRSVVARSLERDGHAVLTASTIEAARVSVLAGVDLVVLDLGLPDGSGVEFCRELRERNLSLPILILTARTQVDVRVQGLDAGADDFVAKPFAISELRARVRALGRRGNILRAFSHTHADVVLDLAGRKASRAGQAVPVTAREWAIIEVLANRVGRFTTKEALLDAVWGDASERAGNSLEVLIARLRKKFGPTLIETLRGEGYSLRGGAGDGNAA